MGVNYFLIPFLLIARVATVDNEITNYVQLPYKGRFLELNSGHPCRRNCDENETRICYYNFKVEWYHTMSRACHDCPANKSDCFREDCIPGDGVSRAILTVNKRMPGPSIEVCHGDEIIIDVENHLSAEETTIHWHGHHQRGTPYMDGVPHVTQCGIPVGGTFQYRFKAAHSGTHFWHSHTGLQRGEGVFGPMIVRIPKQKDVHHDLYDFDLSDHVIIVLDWLHETGLNKFLIHHHSDGDNKPETLLVNGKGYFKTTNETDHVPASRFEVKQGFRYRFRVINAEFLNCPIEISIDNHTLTVISSDGNDFEPVIVDSVVTYAGERFDFIVNADQEMNNYWMRFRGLMDCDARFTSAHQVAVLHYDGAEEDIYPAREPDYGTSHKNGIQLNVLNEGTGSNSNESLVIPELNALLDDDVSLKSKPDYQFYISYDFYKMLNPNFYSPGKYEYYDGHKKFKLTTPQLNHISMKFQPVPLLSGRDLLSEDNFCNETSVKNCENTYCDCTHVLKVKLQSVVELILVDKGVTFDANHPFHLHGNTFRVVAMERLSNTTTVEEIQELDKKGLIKRKLSKAPVKDTVTVPDGGYTILRFHANNPGYWLFHCHIDFHAEIGMALVFKVGENSDMPPIPKKFPTCNSFTPEIKEKHKMFTVCENPNNNLFTCILEELQKMIINKYKFVEERIFNDTKVVNSSSNNHRINKMILFVLAAFLWQ